MTRHQFGPGVTLTSIEGRDRDYLLSDEGTRRRYLLLHQEVVNELRCHGES
jgi:hypothetical protein